MHVCYIIVSIIYLYVGFYYRSSKKLSDGLTITCDCSVVYISGKAFLKRENTKVHTHKVLLLL